MAGTVVTGCVLLVGALLAGIEGGSYRGDAAGSAAGEVRVCDRYGWCSALPIETSCSSTPFAEIAAVENRSAVTVELYRDGCFDVVAMVPPQSFAVIDVEAGSYLMR